MSSRNAGIVSSSRDGRSRLRELLGLVAWLAISFAAAAAGSVASISADTFYQSLLRPSWAPPSWLFGPVWTVLYALLGIAAWLVWRAWGIAGAKLALSLFVVQLAANALWTWVFFAWRQGALAFAEIMLLLVLIVATLVAFWHRHRLAALLLVPYLAWVTYASALTYSLWQLNPELR
jgi:translocator protein